MRSPELLTAFGISGVVTTAYLTAKATIKAYPKVYHEDRDPHEPPSKMEVVKLVWKDYIPPVAVGAATIGCVFGSHKASARRTAAAVAAYSVADKALTEYKDQVLEAVGQKKADEVEQAVVAESIKKNPPPTDGTLVVTGTDQLFYDLATGRYFKSDVNAVQSAVNKINKRLLEERYCSVREFYGELGVWGGDLMDQMGWEAPNLMDVVMTPSLNQDTNEVYIALTFNYVKPLMSFA